MEILRDKMMYYEKLLSKPTEFHSKNDQRTYFDHVSDRKNLLSALFKINHDIDTLTDKVSHDFIRGKRK